jgi:hypothetical protein
MFRKTRSPSVSDLAAPWSWDVRKRTTAALVVPEGGAAVVDGAEV